MDNFYLNKNVFITGHTGFKGSWLTYWLLKLGANVTGYSKDLPTNPSLYDQLKLSTYLENDYREDILDLQKLKDCLQVSKADIVFHLAAQPIVSESYLNPLNTFSTNLIGSLNLFETLRCCSRESVVVFITSDKCYENKEWIYGYREEDNLGGKDPYSASKACAEIGLRALGLSFPQRTFRYCTSRAGNVIGGGDWSIDRIVPDCIRRWTDNKPVVIRNPSATRPWQHVLEPISGYLELAKTLSENQSLDGNSFNFGPPTSQDVTVGEICNLLSKDWPGAKIRINESLSIGRESSLLKLDISKSLSLLKWSPRLSIEECASMTANWYLQMRDGTSPQDLCNSDINFYMDKS